MIACFIVCIATLAVQVLFRRQPFMQNIRNPCRMLLLFGLLGILAEASQQTAADGIADGRIARNAPGKGELETEASLYLPQEDTEYPITVTIAERRYGKQEEQTLLAAAKEEIRQTFCGENASREKMLSDPYILERYQEGAVKAEWMFSERDLLSPEGKRLEKEPEKEGREVKARVILTCGESEAEYRFSFRIFPREKSGKEMILQEVKQQIAEQDAKKTHVVLPTSVNGKEIEWRSERQGQGLQLLMLGALAAVAAAYAKKEQKEKQKKKQKQRMLLAYPEFVSKLSLLLGAGMTISGALRKMGAMYQRKKADGGKEEEVYEALHCMLCEIENGRSEWRAYQAFSERCGLQPYRKLVSLLLTGQRVGSRRLMEQLNAEADRVFLERKHAARRLGEEAGTKMLLPMLLLLLIVMAIVMIPAFLSIYGNGGL